MCSPLPRGMRWTSPHPPGIWQLVEEMRCLFHIWRQNTQRYKESGCLPASWSTFPHRLTTPTPGGCFPTSEASIKCTGLSITEGGRWNIRERLGKGIVEFPRPRTRYDLPIFSKLDLVVFKKSMPLWLPKSHHFYCFPLGYSKCLEGLFDPWFTGKKSWGPQRNRLTTPTMLKNNEPSQKRQGARMAETLSLGGILKL